MFHSSSSKQVIPFRTASLSLAVCHSRRVPPFSFLLAPLFFRSFSLLLRSPPLFFARSKAPPFLAVPHSSSSWFLFFVFFPFDRSYSSLSFFFPPVPRRLVFFCCVGPDLACHFSDTLFHSHVNRRSRLSTIDFYGNEKSVNSFSSSLASPFSPPFL